MAESNPKAAGASAVAIEPISVERTIDSGRLGVSGGATLPTDAQYCPFDGSELSGKRQEQRRNSLIGFIIDERYEVLQLLGEGGMGCVYRVRHRVLGRLFALKALRLELARDVVTAERFIQEAQATAAINHPSIVKINDFGMLSTGQPYFVMELMEGRTLSSLLAERVILSPLETVGIANVVGQALGAAHDSGIVHRDLKPDNVIVQSLTPGAIRLKVLDFGLAMVHGNDRLTRDGVVFGTPQYMSPEQATGEPLDVRADVYSLGIVMFEMLTGRVPFEADSYMGVLTKQLYAQPVAPSSLRPELLEHVVLDQIILRCLRKNPEERYSSMQQLCAALDDLSALYGISSGPDSYRARIASVRPPLDSRIRRRARRHRLWFYAFAGVVALGAALVLLYQHLVHRVG